MGVHEIRIWDDVVISWDPNLADRDPLPFIDPSRVGKIIEVRLDSTKLTAIPGWVHQFPNLEQLILPNISLDKLTIDDVTHLKQLKNLKELSLGGPIRSKIPDDFAELKGLQSLSLSLNDGTFLPGTFHTMKNITKLRLRGNITTFPSEVLKMGGLKELDISDANLRWFPDEPSRMEALESFTASRSWFERFPPGFFPGKKMKKLDVSGSDLRELPEITEWPEFEELIIDGTPREFDSLPEDIGDCKKLRVLSVVSWVKEIPDSIGRCTSLENLAVGGEVRSLPKSLGNCTNLKELWINSSYIFALPRELGQCKQLTKVKFDHWYAIPDDHPLRKIIDHYESV
nr:hypothetical protein [Candidatus Sigynarchaeota archaeon]